MFLPILLALYRITKAASMFGKKRIWQKPASNDGRQHDSPGTQGRAEPTAGGPPVDALVAIIQRLQREIADRKLCEDHLKIHLDRLEQRIKGQSIDLIEGKEHLKHLHDELTEKLAQMTAANEQMQRQVVEQEHYLNQKLAGLIKVVQQLQGKLGDINQKEIELLEDIIDAKPPDQETPGLNPQELKALSELARRLAQ